MDENLVNKTHQSNSSATDLINAWKMEHIKITISDIIHYNDTVE
jgi:hypothetical protein